LHGDYPWLLVWIVLIPLPSRAEDPLTAMK
jgi:hypothetical protein